MAAGRAVRRAVRIAAGAEVEAGAEVGPDAVIDAGARVTAGARVRRAVVWAGATATGDVADAVATTTGSWRSRAADGGASASFDADGDDGDVVEAAVLVRLGDELLAA